MRGLFKSFIFPILACYLTSAQEIRCAPPKIAHGTITDGKMEYSENDPIKYECDEGYRPRRGAPKCLKSGWSITPECEEKVCRLEFVRYRVESTTPIGKNIFRIGENVTITCSENYFLHFTKLNPGTIKCLDSGEWETPPVCEEPGCPEPTVENARILRKSEHPYKPGERIEYQCLPGYEPERFTVTCDRDGRWQSMRYCTEKVCRLESVSHGVESTTPIVKNVFRIGENVTITCSEKYWGVFTKLTLGTIKCLDSGEWETPPVCEEIECDIPMYQHVRYPQHYFSMGRKLGARVSYYCEYGYKQKATYATCTKNGWTPNPLCEEPGCPEPTVENARILRKSEHPYKPGERIEYQCLPGYEPERFTVTCDRDGRWQSMRYCTEKVCRLESVSYGVKSTTPIGKNIFRIGETVTVTCSEKYWGVFTKQNTQTIKCLDSGEWETPPVCEEIECDIPMDQHVRYPQHYFSWDRKLGARVSYYCEYGYKQKATYATCTKNGWTPNPLCEEPGCPEPTVENARILRKSEHPYKPGERIEYQCLPGYEPERFTVTCDRDGRWQSMRYCTVRRVGCGRPPLIPQAVQDFKEQYEEDEKATYDCPSYYVQEGDAHMVCKQGRWTGNGRCLKPCTVDVHVLDDRKIELKVGGRRKIYSQHNDFITFVCAQGYRHTGEVELRQRCTDGVIPLPTCV